MIGALAGGVGAVVAARTSGGTGKRAVIRLGAGPTTGGLVAALAACCGG